MERWMDGCIEGKNEGREGRRKCREKGRREETDILYYLEKIIEK